MLLFQITEATFYNTIYMKVSLSAITSLYPISLACVSSSEGSLCVTSVSQKERWLLCAKNYLCKSKYEFLYKKERKICLLDNNSYSLDDAFFCLFLGRPKEGKRVLETGRKVVFSRAQRSQRDSRRSSSALSGSPWQQQQQEPPPLIGQRLIGC